MVERKLLLGNEAIARGAYEAGVRAVTGYPGTPSTEIIESVVNFLKQHKDIYCEWSANEKVALEVGYGASLVGERSLVTMKHVGLNVAADSFFTISYTGTNAGLVIVSADDPGMYSSQNEQDNRNYAKSAKVPMVEPSDSQECLDFTKKAFDMSEEYGTPVLLRTTMRVSHTRTPVVLGERREVESKEYVSNPGKYVCLPANSRKMRKELEDRLFRLEEESNNSNLNVEEWSGNERGIITSGVVYQYVKEAEPNVSILKLGMTYPLPRKKIREFADKVNELEVIEELDSFLKEQVLAMGIKVVDRKILGIGELSPDIIAGIKIKDSDTIPRPPKWCDGCYYNEMFKMLKELHDDEGIKFVGDIGCYTLGALEPYKVLDTTLCMGASTSMASGMSKKGKYAAVIGDSTFWHSGLLGLENAVHHGYNVAIIIADNKTTAMTGAQGHPGTDYDLMGEARPIILDKVVEAMGANCKRVEVMRDPKGFKEAVYNAVFDSGVNVVIAGGVCLQYAKMRKKNEK